LNLIAITFVSGRLTDRTFADDKTESPASGATPVRNLGRLCSITPANAIRRKRIEAVSLASTGPPSSNIAEDRRQVRRRSSQLDLYVTASRLGGQVAIALEFACKRNLTIHPITDPWAAGQLPAAA
jgi:hypothetical protein